MKRLFIAFVAMVATTLSFTSCDKETDMIVDFSTLPAAAQSTITTHFDKDQIMLVTYDKELFDKEYSVTLFDGTVIEFDKDGSWESIESNIAGVPMSIIPDNIAQYLTTYYAEQMVVEIDKDTTGYDLTLENRVELEFNLSGTLIGVDMN
ncbi:MAG: PepSY-like domain-containing protein [Rikenellaceae bacterium]